MAFIVFMDTETTGLDHEDEIWEFAAIRRDDEGNPIRFHAFVQHDVSKAENLPDSFRADHDARYDPAAALSYRQFADLIRVVFVDRPHVVGCVPNFDTERLARVLRNHGTKTPPWHYHLKDAENIAIGYLRGLAFFGDEQARAALVNTDDSDALSRACGVEPPGEGVRHTAMGDVEWAMAVYDAVMAGPDANVWIVPKVSHDENRGVGPILHGRHGKWIHRSQGTSEAAHTRFYAALLLAAADESDRIAEARGTAEQSDPAVA